MLPALWSRAAPSLSRAVTPALVVTAKKARICLGECRADITEGVVNIRQLTRMDRLISALAITPVGAYFLWPSGESGHHGHDEHHEEHHEEAEAKEEEQPTEEEKPAEEEKPEKKESEETAKPSGTEGESQPRADANKKSSGSEETEERMPRSGPSSTEGVQGKGQMSNESEGMNQGSKREPDGKGAFKNRKDSALQKDLSRNPDDVYAEDGKTESVSRQLPTYLPQPRTCN